MMLKMYFTTIFSRRSIIRFPFWKIFLLQRPTAKRWLKFARSLKLRLAMRIRYVEPDLALQYAQEAIEGGVITSTDENALLQTYRQITVTNPLEMIWNSYNDARMGASMDSYLNGYEDPRREKMFQPATITGGGFIPRCPLQTFSVRLRCVGCLLRRWLS